VTAAAEAAWIDRPETLAAAGARWRDAPEIALDTEFVFERTFRPRLGLVQVATADRIDLVDAAPPAELAPLAAALASPGVRKVAHAAAGDLAVLHRATGVAPRPLLDTQVAAAFCGLGSALSYAALVRELFGVELPKHETRTDWLRRPLLPEQLRYAAEDVEHLLPAAHELERRLEALGRLEWAREDSDALVAAALAPPDPDDGWRRVKGLEGLPAGPRRVARELALWREREAERLDLARPFLLRDETLLALARRATTEEADLRKLPGVDRRRHEPHFAAWRAALEAARAAAKSGAPDGPGRPASPFDREAAKAIGQAVARVVEQAAAGLALPPELLLSRRQRDRLLRGWDGTTPLSERLAGFRRGLLGAALDEIRPA
jgi:ribonuclease D